MQSQEGPSDLAPTSEKSQKLWTRGELDRLFQKQPEAESRVEETNRKLATDWYRNRWLRKKTQSEYPNDALAKERRWREDRRGKVAGARFEAREIPEHLSRRRREKYLEILKQGVLAGKIEICETSGGFEITSPRETVWEYVRQHPEFKESLPRPEYLEEGGFLLGIVDKIIKERVKLVRDSLVAEFEADSPSDYMLIDLAVANYIRAMQATKMEMQSLWYADDYPYEMFEVVATGLQPYIHGCQNELMKVLSALRRQDQRSGISFTRRTYSRTEINLQNWGLPLLIALLEINGKKESKISIDEIKQTMLKNLPGVSSDDIHNEEIGYALRDLGFTDCLHTSTGNVYKIPKQTVQVLLNEALKA